MLAQRSNGRGEEARLNKNVALTRWRSQVVLSVVLAWVAAHLIQANIFELCPVYHTPPGFSIARPACCLTIIIG